MPVAVQNPEIAYTANGVTTIFAYPFQVLSAADIIVLVDEVGETLNVDYAVTGVGVQSGGAVVFSAPPANGARVAINRSTPLNRDIEYQYSGDFQSPTVNRDFDRLWMALQDLFAKIVRGLHFPYGDNANSELPVAAQRLDRLLAFSPTTAEPVMTDFTVTEVASAIAAAYEGSKGPLDALTFIQAGAGAGPRTAQDKVREQISVVDFTGTDTSKLQAAVNLAGPMRGDVYVPPGQFDISVLDAKAGTKFYGPGQLRFTPDANSANYRVLNSYADSVSYDLGKEYLYAFHAVIYGFARPKVFLYGDSTVRGFNSTAPYRPQDVLEASFFAQGLSSFEIGNAGVDGSHAGDWDPSAAIADTNVRLMIVGYGINDGSYPPIGDALELFYTNMAARLTTIRATRGVDTMAICLKAGNSTNDWFNGRHQVWHERLNGVYKRLAREFQCYFFDAYALWADSQGSVPWMDSIPYGGQQSHIHPTNLGNQWIWGKLAEELVPKSLARNLYNNVRNVREDYSALAATVTPADMPYGISIHRANIVGGWVHDGAVITIKQADGVATQRNVRFGADSTASAVRHATSSTTWAAFTGAENIPTLFSGWTNYDVNFAPASWYLDEEGGVNFSGVIKPSGALTNTVILTLPTWARPAKNKIFELSCNTGRCQAVLTATGDLTPLVYSGTPGWVSLESIRFKP